MDRRPGRSPSLLGLEGSFALIRFLMVGLKLLTIDLPLSWMFERASKAVTYQEAFSSEELDRKLFLRLGQNYDEPKAWSDANPWLLGLDRLSLETLTWPWSQIWNSQDAWKWKSTWDEIVSKKLEEEDSRSSSFSSSSSDHLENESPVPRDAKRISFIENKEPQMVPFKTIPIPNAEEPQKDNHSNPQLKPPRHENISQMFKEMEQRAALRQQTRSLFDPLEAHVPPKTKSISELKPTTQEHKPLAKLKPALNLEHSRELEPAPELEPGLDLEPAPELKPSPVLEPTPELKLTSNYKPNPKSKRIVSPSRAKSPKVAELCSKFESTNANGTEAKLFKVKEMPQGAVVRKAKVVTKPSANGAISQSDNSLEKHDDDTASGIMPNSSTVIPKIVIRSYEERCATLPPPPKPVTMRHDPVSKPSPNPGPLPKPTLEKAIPRRPNPRPRMEFHYQPPIAVTKDSKAHLHHSSTPILTSIQTLEDQPEGANWNSTWELGSNSTLREASHQNQESLGSESTPGLPATSRTKMTKMAKWRRKIFDKQRIHHTKI
ncbi:titin-like [Tigriopus californicus]|uniref:titin-like n=1 Tax=Tigriopus californicus TaxID=6832 RepID=UPI0027DA16DF|nr:titin-like [Tigriopus californicus]